MKRHFVPNIVCLRTKQETHMLKGTVFYILQPNDSNCLEPWTSLTVYFFLPPIQTPPL